MRALISKAKLEAEIAGRFGKSLTLQEKNPVQTLSSGIAPLDEFTGGIPRGAVTEVFGTASSGRTSFLYSMLAYATTHEEICAIVDTHDVFTPTVAAKAGLDFDRLLWVRCGANLEHAFKVTDLLLHAGGFGLVALDLGDVPVKDAKRIISSWWHRFRRTVENKPVIVVVLTAEACVRSCAALSLELKAFSEWAALTDAKLNSVHLHEWKQRKLSRQLAFRGLNDLSVTHGNLLHVNSIEVNRHRPLTPARNQTNFKVLAC